MKKTSFITLLAVLIFALNANAQTSTQQKMDTLLVEASCGECQFGLKGKSCDLAVRINGKAYFVEGTKIDDHGDAHAKDGFCNAIRQAKVVGTIINDRFVASYFKLTDMIKNESKD
jgi:hypothetical protein